MTEAEFKSLSPREQDRVQRMVLRREAGGYGSAFSGMWGSAGQVPFSRCKRIGEFRLFHIDDPTLFLSCVSDEKGLRRNLGICRLVECEDVL